MISSIRLRPFTGLSAALLVLFSFSGCRDRDAPEAPAPGVPLDLAQQRAARLDSLRYTLHFELPRDQKAPIPARLEIEFDLSDASQGLALDFAGGAEQVKGIWKGEAAVEAMIADQHIVIPAHYLETGKNRFRIEFIAGDGSLNRSEDYLYTLLVPDRARTVFPCFDQPDLKARYRLSLSLPDDWVAVANGAEEAMAPAGEGRKTYRFAETLPIPTYLFAFAAGRFQVQRAERNGRPMTMYYRETDTAKVAANAGMIFDLHAQAIGWLEEYTGIPLPFPKFDFVLIPGFQYGGMEHVGCIFYKEPSLMLDASATENQRLGRARLIAHETAHMWFGDLVTMQWFNDVWLKEVFANFMAAKAVNPSFPDINHELSFLLSHQPAAYAEDRSQGSHPIQQPLENLKDAGALYGRIIYQKAPVVMRQLEKLMGPEAFRAGLREYLRSFSYGNATWDELVAILDRQTEVDLTEWSAAWVKEAGMPVIDVDLQTAQGRIERLLLRPENDRYQPQHTVVALIYRDSIVRFPVELAGTVTSVPAAGRPAPLAVLANASEMAYGYFRLPATSQAYLLEQAGALEDPLLRGAAWLTLYEAVLRGDLPSSDYFQALRRALPEEKEPLNRHNLMGDLYTLYWKFISPDERRELAPEMESLLWALTLQGKDASAKAAYFRTYRHFALSEEAVAQLERIWDGRIIIPGLPLSESDRTELAETLALRLPGRADSILDAQLARLDNPDRRQRLSFIRPALSGEEAVRDTFFESLKRVENRHYEPWVVDAVGYLHHPLRAEQSLRYIYPGLELLEEIQATGDIFFPRQWAGATLEGHRSPEAAALVRRFLQERPDYPYRLRNKILMAADLLFRVSELSQEERLPQ